MSGMVMPPKPGRKRVAWQARHDDTCPECLGDILQGQDIVQTVDGMVHLTCDRSEGGYKEEE